MTEHDLTTLPPPEPPPVDIVAAIRDLDLATHDDVVAMNERIDTLLARVESVEQSITALPQQYASIDAVTRITNSQAEYEARSRQLTEQVASVVNVQADMQQKYASIESRLSELSTMRAQLGTIAQAVTGMTGNMDTFMKTQGERLENQHKRLEAVDKKLETLGDKVETVETIQTDSDLRYTTTFAPVSDFINGSATQKPLKTVIDGIQTSVNQQNTQLAEIANYVKAEQAKEQARQDFYRRVRLQMASPKGIFALLAVVVFVIILAQAVNLDQMFERVRQFASLFGSG